MRKDCYHCGNYSCDARMEDGTGSTVAADVKKRREIHSGKKCPDWCSPDDKVMEMTKEGTLEERIKALEKRMDALEESLMGRYGLRKICSRSGDLSREKGC
jgi:hypothetical protein